uniref:Agenet domain-containing protein n=1 Tax=Setaria viridis TaxID=4556 RepID=A0A4U6U2X2_SETVI|nr:hypothetical protein SEVIR_6G034700v2 [Setaria viridis]
MWCLCPTAVCDLYELSECRIGSFVEWCNPHSKKEWVRVFEKNPTSSDQNSRESTQLMIRSPFPQCDGTAIVNEAWKVGDLVDWFTEGCYWFRTITNLLDEDMFEVSNYELPCY